MIGWHIASLSLSLSLYIYTHATYIYTRLYILAIDLLAYYAYVLHKTSVIHILYIHIYIYIERERERERESDLRGRIKGSLSAL